ncbi:MAG: polysaccharide deacetylase family protein [Verrucomicrobiota bacterium]
MRLKRKVSAGLRWLGSRKDARGAALLYHRIDNSELDPFGLCVSPENFEDHVASLTSEGDVLSLHEFMKRSEEGTLERGSTCLTFDDGYLDVFENALPILEKYEVPATVFVTTGNLAKPFWWDQLAALVFGSEGTPETLLLEAAQYSPIHVGHLSASELYDLLYPVLRSASPERRDAIFEILAPQLNGIALDSKQRAATAEELSRASSHPLLTLGAHTVTHSRLSSLGFYEQMLEISSSVKTLEEIVGARVDTLAYPFGLAGRDYNDHTLRAAGELGIQYAFSANLGAVSASTDRLEIPRLWVHDRAAQSVRNSVRFWTGGTSTAAPRTPASVQ